MTCDCASKKFYACGRSADEHEIERLNEVVKVLTAELRSVVADLKCDLEYRHDCLEHSTADCEVPGCEDPDECSRCLTLQRLDAALKSVAIQTKEENK